MLHHCHYQNINFFSQNQKIFFGGGIAIKHPFALEEQVETLYSKIMFEQHFFLVGASPKCRANNHKHFFITDHHAHFCHWSLSAGLKRDCIKYDF